jgi:hypothetical protein
MLAVARVEIVLLLPLDPAQVVSALTSAVCAVLDAGALADCLIGIYQGKAGDELLDLYAQIRREKYLKYIDERSKRNFNRVRNQDPDRLLENDKLLKIFQEIEGDAEATRAFLLVSIGRLPSYWGHSRYRTKTMWLMSSTETFQHRIRLHTTLSVTVESCSGILVVEGPIAILYETKPDGGPVDCISGCRR